MCVCIYACALDFLDSFRWPVQTQDGKLSYLKKSEASFGARSSKMGLQMGA